VIPQVIALATVGAGVYLLYRWFKHAEMTHEHRYREEVYRVVAEWMASHTAAAAAELQDALRALVEEGIVNPLLNGLREIDCEFTKLSPTTVRQTVVVLLDRDGRGTVGRLTYDMGWDDLPEEVRAGFIRTGTDTQTFRILGMNTTAPTTPEGAA
jgi:hypothetical protein